jgi:hypothetical protein
MKKTKIEEKVNYPFHDFFEDDRENAFANGLRPASDGALLKEETAALFDEKGDRLLKILKRAFVFLPGVMYLFFGTFSILAFDFLWRPLTVSAVFLIGSFMTIFGIGSLKNPKHLVIPFSIIASAVAAFGFFSTFAGLKSVFEYGIYFFPLALIAPLLAKSLVDSRK